MVGNVKDISVMLMQVFIFFLFSQATEIFTLDVEQEGKFSIPESPTEYKQNYN